MFACPSPKPRPHLSCFRLLQSDSTQGGTSASEFHSEIESQSESTLPRSRLPISSTRSVITCSRLTPGLRFWRGTAHHSEITLAESVRRAPNRVRAAGVSRSPRGAERQPPSPHSRRVSRLLPPNPNPPQPLQGLARPRPVQPPAVGEIVALPEVGGLHHRYERRAA
jgi:hypothetical protein